VPDLKVAVVDLARSILRQLAAEAPLRHFMLERARDLVARPAVTDGYRYENPLADGAFESAQLHAQAMLFLDMGRNGVTVERWQQAVRAS